MGPPGADQTTDDPILIRCSPTASAKPGWLKVFGATRRRKTYSMLRRSNACRVKADGVDVVIGLVETHGRAETSAWLRARNHAMTGEANIAIAS